MQKDKPTRFPSHSKKVFEGILYDVYHWTQELYDGTTTTYERINRQDTISVLGITEDKKIMLIEEEQPHRSRQIGLVAGKVDPGEKPLQAAERELLEETGYQAKSIEKWIEYTPDLNTDWTVFIYIAKGLKKVAEQSLEGGEKITPLLYTFNEFINFASSDDFQSLQIKIKVLEAKLNPEKMSELKKDLGLLPAKSLSSE